MFNASLQENETVVGKDRVWKGLGEEMERVACLCNAADGKIFCCTFLGSWLLTKFLLIKSFVTKQWFHHVIDARREDEEIDQCVEAHLNP